MILALHFSSKHLLSHFLPFPLWLIFSVSNITFYLQSLKEKWNFFPFRQHPLNTPSTPPLPLNFGYHCPITTTIWLEPIFSPVYDLTFIKPGDVSSHLRWIFWTGNINTFTAIVDLRRFNNSCLKSPASTLVDLTFQSRALRSFSLNQLRNLSL